MLYENLQIQYAQSHQNLNRKSRYATQIQSYEWLICLIRLLNWLWSSFDSRKDRSHLPTKDWTLWQNIGRRDMGTEQSATVSSWSQLSQLLQESNWEVKKHSDGFLYGQLVRWIHWLLNRSVELDQWWHPQIQEFGAAAPGEIPGEIRLRSLWMDIGGLTLGTVTTSAAFQIGGFRKEALKMAAKGVAYKWDEVLQQPVM